LCYTWRLILFTKKNDLIIDKIDFVWKVISRYDTYISTTNYKATIILTLNIFLISGITFKSTEILIIFNNLPTCRLAIVIILLLIGISVIYSICRAILAIEPNLGKNNNQNKTILFFDHVKSLGSEKYLEKLNNMKPNDFLSDLCEDGWNLANILSEKLRNLSHSVWVFKYIQITLLIILILLIGYVMIFEK